MFPFVESKGIEKNTIQTIGLIVISIIISSILLLIRGEGF